MGDEQGQSGLGEIVFFLDENHCRNPHVIEAVTSKGFMCEKHLDHFLPGAEDTEWLPVIGQRGWCLITTDARIASNLLEREAVRVNRIRMFYFSRNNFSGREMGAALKRALPEMQRLVESQPAPFIASLNKSGEVVLRNTFDQLSRGYKDKRSRRSVR